MKVREWQREVIKSGSGGRKRIDAVKMLSFFPSLEDYVTWLMEGLRWVDNHHNALFYFCCAKNIFRGVRTFH